MHPVFATDDRSIQALEIDRRAASQKLILMLNVKSLASNELPIPHGLAPAAALYGAAYATALLLVAVSIFSRRDLK